MSVSVLINNYNYGKYLKACLDSVLAQTYSDIEIVVYDDGSTDHSLEILNEYRNNRNISVISNKNYGKNHNLNQMNAVYQAFKRCNGDYIFLLDSDDMFYKEKVEVIVEVFKQNPHIDVIQHQMHDIDMHGASLGVVTPVLLKVEDYKSYIKETKNLLHLFSPTSALVFKRAFLEHVMPMDEDNLAYMAVDTRLMLLAALNSTILTLYNPLSYYRKHGVNNSNRLGPPEAYDQYIKELYYFYNTYARKSGVEQITYSKENVLASSYFYSQIDRDRCLAFVGERPFYIWGSGEAGQSICFLLESKKHNMTYFIDSDKRKHGFTTMEKVVSEFKPDHFGLDALIIVSPYYAYEPIKRQLEANGLVEGINFIDPYIRK